MDQHHTVHLTKQGVDIAESTLQRNSLLYSLLQSLGVPQAIATEDACAIEHNMSPETYEALKQLFEERQVNV